MRKKKKHLLILDANILIDFYNYDMTIIQLIGRNVGQIYLPTPILDEIDEIDEDCCTELGIILIEPTLDQALSASAKNGPLSFQDNLCLIIAKEHGWTCVTNDKPLRRKV
jgi:rRNA-processing protein FCF1